MLSRKMLATRFVVHYSRSFVIYNTTGLDRSQMRFRRMLENIDNLYNARNSICGPIHSGTALLLIAECTALISEMDTILEQWVEHFVSLHS